jgi:hypothetical protein
MLKNIPFHRLVFYFGQATFVVLIGLFIAYSEFFYSDRSITPKSNPIVTYTSPIFSVEDINEFSISNHKGKIVLKKHLSGAWYIANDQGGPQFFAKEDMMKTLLTESSALHFKNRYPIDAINKVNYSLTTPMATLHIGKNQTEFFKIIVGITNPVNSSSYVTINEAGLIFQIEKFSLNLSVLSKEDFSDPVILPFHFNKISSLEWSIPSGGTKSGTAAASNSKKLTRDERGNWYDQYGKIVKAAEVENFLKELRAIKSKSFTSRSNLPVAETTTTADDSDEPVDGKIPEKIKKIKLVKNSLDGAVLFDLKVNFSDGEMPFQILKGKNAARERNVASKDSSNSQYEVYLVNEGLSANINQESYNRISTAIKSLPTL